MYDCLVIGGGLIGMLSARELAIAGLSVAVIEQGRCGGESSWAGGGILSPLYPWRYEDAVTALASWSQSHYPDFIEEIYAETGIDPEFQPDGMLILHVEDGPDAQDWARRWQRNLYAVTRDEMQKLEPALGDVPDSGIWMPDVGQVRNPRLVKAMRESLLKHEVTLYEHNPVLDLIAENGQIQGVRLEKETLRAEKVVIAGGAWSSQLLAKTGVHLPVKPVRGQMLLFRAPAGLVSRMVLSRDRYVIPRRDGRVLVGSTLENTGFDKSTTEAAQVELRQEALRLIPALEKYAIEHHWAGLRPGSPSGIPYISKHPEVAGLFVNTGHFRNGVVLGLASARLLADLLLSREPLIEPQAYEIKGNKGL